LDAATLAGQMTLIEPQEAGEPQARLFPSKVGR
jgi:hypothetical protein